MCVHKEGEKGQWEGARVPSGLAACLRALVLCASANLKGKSREARRWGSETPPKLL